MKAWRAWPWVSATVLWCVLLAVAVVPSVRALAEAQLEWMLQPLFHDWHVVRLGWAVAATGRDPLADLTVPFNYPRFVLLGRHLGILSVPAHVSALALAAIFLASAAWALRPATRAEAFASALALWCIPVLLMIERGNLDALAFALVVAGVVLFTRAEPRPLELALGAAAFLIAAAMKLYPAAALAGGIVLGAARGGGSWREA